MRTKEEARDYGVAYRASHPGYDANYYLDHRKTILETQAKACDEFTEWLQILRANNGCEDCETHEGWLEHHHLDPSTKRFNISHMYGSSLDTLEDELEKCVVLCRSCHKKRHRHDADSSLPPRVALLTRFEHQSGDLRAPEGTEPITALLGLNGRKRGGQGDFPRPPLASGCYCDYQHRVGQFKR